MLQIDGSQGEGGGQIIRSSLALSAVTGKAFEVRNIRGGRKKPGLLKQHLTGLKAAREICGAGVTGAELHSSQFTFAPGSVQTRGFRLSIGSAGSATLVAQTVLPALITADGKSSIEIEGGTHNMAAPPFDFVSESYLPLVSKLGPQFESNIQTYGFFPAGGGNIKIEIDPVPELKSLQLIDHGGTYQPTVTALVSRLPVHIGEREVTKIRRKAGWKLRDCQVRNITNSPGPGNCVMIRLKFPNVTEIFTGFGKKGVTAEQVATNAWQQTATYLAHEAPVGEYLADQLLLPLAIAAHQGQTSRFLTGELSMHTKTQIDIINLFLEIDIQVVEKSPMQNEVVLSPKKAPT